MRARAEGIVVFLLSFAIYTTVAGLLAFRFHLYPSDAVSRMANGFYVLYSADPHLAAMGFAWNPLQSICDLALLLFKDAWPALATRDMAGGLVSAAAMAGAVYQVGAALRERGVLSAPRILLTALFALSPMIVFFGGNGMSEALYLFTLIACTRYLWRWQRSGDLKSLVYAGVAMGLAYLARNEALGAAALATVLVFVAAALHGHEGRRANVRAAVTDAAIFCLPVLATIGVWAMSSYVITGQFFPQIAANAVQIKASSFASGSPLTRLNHELTAVEALAPLLPLLIALALIRAWRRRDGGVFVPLAVLGGGLAFDLFSYLDGSLFPWLRFYILAIPIAVLLTGDLLADPARKSDRAGRHAGKPRTSVLVGTSALSVLLVAPSFLTSAKAMLNPSVGAGETSEYLGAIFHVHKTAQDEQVLHSWATVESIDSYLMRMHLHSRSVIVDNIDTCVPNIVVQNSDPTMFVIPNDRDFQKVAADPLTFDATYFLLPPEQGVDATGELAHEYPTLYDTGDLFTRLVHQFHGGGVCPTFRLYEVLGHPPGIGGYG